MSTSIKRQEWLESASLKVRSLFEAKGFDVPEKIRVSIGFPKGGGGGSKKIGQCWSPSASSDKYSEVFISPELKDSVRILGVLAHEFVHATVGCEAGHKGPFKRCAEAIGLTGKMTATTEGPSFVTWAQTVTQVIGQYPAGALASMASQRKQTTRLLKCECGSCGYTVRTTQKWIDAAGPPICPSDEETMECTGGGGDEE